MSQDEDGYITVEDLVPNRDGTDIFAAFDLVTLLHFTDMTLDLDVLRYADHLRYADRCYGLRCMCLLKTNTCNQDYSECLQGTRRKQKTRAQSCCFWQHGSCIRDQILDFDDFPAVG